jgi:rRNA maturation RNase YbeY
MRETIHFFNENTIFTLRKKKLLRIWICAVIHAEKKVAGEINFIFCDDDYLTRINTKYLKHRTLTDIITFSLSEEERIISGDVFISIPRVRENAAKFKTTFVNELHRVMIHGILHLLGHDDATKKEKEKIHKSEDLCLEMLAGISLKV